MVAFCFASILPERQCDFWSKLTIASAATHALVMLAMAVYYQSAVVARIDSLKATCRRILKGEPIAGAAPTTSADELAELDLLIRELADKWSREARAMQFDVEFKAIEYERRRVAKELHDEILPGLSRLTRNIESRGSKHTSGKIVDALHSTVAAFRDLLGELHPVDLEEFGLVSSLHSLCRRYARLTGRLVCFIDQVEDFPLTELQELCLYRAMQAVLRMFTNSDNDILIISCDRIEVNNVIIIRCVDKRVSSADWLSVEKSEFAAFEAWCAMAEATTEIGTIQYRGFPCDLIVTIPGASAETDQSC